MKTRELRSRVDSCMSDRTNVEGVWEIIEQFVIPYRGVFFSDYMSEGSVEWRNRQLYDSTGVESAQSLAANIHSALTNPSDRWFNLRFKQESLNQMHGLKVWLEGAVESTYMAIQESNFNLEANEVYLDLTTFGTSVMVEESVEDRDGGLDRIDFQAAPLYQCYFEEDSQGKLSHFYRELQWTSGQIIDKFGDKVPEKVKTHFDSNKEVNKKWKIIYAIYRRKADEPVDTFGVLDPLLRPYGYKYFLYQECEMLGEEGGYYEMPAFVPRWRKTAGSVWGNSPSMIALGDILTLNQLVELILKANEKVIDPAILTTRRGVFGNIHLEASGVTVVDSPDAIKPFESGARFDVSNLSKADLQAAIKRAFFVDQLQLKESPAMTATEVTVRYQLMQRLLGPTLGRLQFDFLDPIIERTLKILYRYKEIPPLPSEVEGQMAELEIEYVGPMAKSQRFDSVANIERWLQDVGGMAQMFQGAELIVDPEETARELGVGMGVPTRLMRSKQMVKKIQEGQAEKMQQQQQMMQMEQGANIAKTAAETQEISSG